MGGDKGKRKGAPSGADGQKQKKKKVFAPNYSLAHAFIVRIEREKYTSQFSSSFH